MKNKYIAIEHENSKYYKKIPYIKKKQFKQIKESKIVSSTHLKEYKTNSKEDELVLLFNNKEYLVKNKMIGLTKGYIDVGNNEYLILKTNSFFLLFILLLLFIFLFLLIFNNKPNNNLPTKNDPTENINDVQTNKQDKSTDSNKTETSKSRYKPKRDAVEEAKGIKYTITFNSNGGDGEIDSIICEGNKVCKLPKNTFTKEGYHFCGWSTEINGEPIYLDEMEVFNVSTENNSEVILYAMWYVDSFGVEHLDYDGNTIEKLEYDYGEKINHPNNPERVGYTFVGWDNEVEEVKEDLKIKALYNINNYEFSYDLGGGAFDEDAPLTYTVEDETFSIPNPKKVGYTFIGWTNKSNKELIKHLEIKKGTIGNIDLTANYEANSYNLIYNINNAKEQISPKSIKYNDKFGELPTLTKEGYDFVNWTNSDNDQVSEDTIFNIPNDIIINANWSVKNYKITYNLIGGKITDNPDSYNTEENIHIPNPKKDGYIFIGWTTKNSTIPVIDYEIKKGTTEDIELTANYKPISYTVVYNSSGGKGIMDNTIIKYNNKVKLNKNTFTREGYNFIGWSLSENGSVEYSNEDIVYNLSTEDNKEIILYAKWETIKLNVKYIDLFGSVLKQEIVEYGQRSSSLENPQIEGYTFNKWDCNLDNIKEDTVCNALYTKNKYIIKYDLNTGNTDDLTELEYYVDSNVIKLSNPTRDGYTFIGWTGSNGAIPQKDIIIEKGSTGNKSFKANWIANVYKVSLNSNNGTVNPSFVNISFNSLYGILPEAERKGYSFVGWKYKEKIIEENTIMKNYDHELIAEWKIINYSISYDLNGGVISSEPKNYNIESNNINIPNPTREGYVFAGWTGTGVDTLTKDLIIEKGSIGDRNYKANWTPINYTISYDLNGGTSSTLPTIYNVESSSINIPNPTRKGYTFTGWTGTNLNNQIKNLTIEKGSMGNRNYTASWTVNYYTVNYYVNNSLWTTKSVAFNSSPENLDAQSALDLYHKFNYWEGMVTNMPSHDISLYANITESFCMLMTGHGPYGNAAGLLKVFNNAGWTGRIEEAPSAPGNYWVVTDYTLTRRQADIQRDYIASHTNYTSYSFPYLYWVGVSCTNGIGTSWTRGLGQSNFTSQ